MSNARIRLRKAREALSRAENSVGLRGRLDVEERYSTGRFVPVLLGPQERGQLIRLLIDACPYEGWVGLYGVRHIGWEWAQRQGMDLERVLVLNPARRRIWGSCARYFWRGATSCAWTFPSSPVPSNEPWRRVPALWGALS